MKNFEFKTVAELEEFLYKLRNRGSKYSLSRMRELCAALGNPQEKYKTIHVAGTNGKGSVCAMLERMLSAGGLKCAMYTSPHLVYLGERIKTLGKPIPKTELLRIMQTVSQTTEEIFADRPDDEKPSFFEYMTAAAFLKFAEQKVDCAVIETGLGGRLDATNILSKPMICAITGISLDHTDLLGDTIEKIAFEKAGIIKSGASVVCGIMPPQARKVMEERAALANSKTYFVEDFFKDVSDMPQSSLKGQYQRKNAATAMLCLKILSAEGKIDIPESVAMNALKSVNWPARWQRIDLPRNKTFMILDASHNIEGAAELEKNLIDLKKEFPKKKLLVTLGSLESGRARALLATLSRRADRVILFEPDNPRALSFEKLESLLPPDFPPYSRGKVEEVFPSENFCAALKKDEILVSTGSIYLAGEILAALSGARADSLQDIIKPV